jgi:hypothetical protein
MEYVGDGKFNLAYMRHTGKWWEVYRGLTADECLKTIRDEAIFQPWGIGPQDVRQTRLFGPAARSSP